MLSSLSMKEDSLTYFNHNEDYDEDECREAERIKRVLQCLANLPRVRDKSRG